MRGSALVVGLGLGAGVAGCQLLLVFDASGGSDAGTAADASDAADSPLPNGDAANHALRCDPRKPFDTPVALDAINTQADETCARATEDETTIYFDRAGTLMVATRPSSNATDWRVRPLITPSDFPAPAGRPFVRGTRLFFDSAGKLYTAAFGPSANAAAGAALIDALNSPDSTTSQSDVWIATSGAFYFVRSTNAGSTIVVAPSETASASALTLPDPATDAPVVSSDGQHLYYAALSGNGAQMARVTRLVGAGVQDREPVGWPESSGFEEFPRWISADECVLYFLRRGGSAGSGDIFRAARPL